jgi:hypothetical protein
MNHTKIACRFALCAGLSVTTLNIQPAYAATLEWSLTFTSNGVDIGTGSFSYDDTKEIVIRTSPPFYDSYIGDKGAPLRSEFESPFPEFPDFWKIERYANPLTSFTATLPGRTWTLSDGPQNWFESTLGSFGCSRTSCNVASQWFFGSSAGFSPGQFVMLGGQAADGSYQGSFISAVLSSTPGTFTSGTWRANAVPEPTTLLGTVVFGAGYVAAKLRRRDKTMR